ncbi:MAG: cyclic 2,3-diphosphoglycerate synthetase, partial [Acidimicrobiia bacterium]
MSRALVLIDGEHYPPVIASAMAQLAAEGHHPVAALFLGGAEKTATLPDLGVPVVEGDPLELLPRLIAEYRPDLVFDLSDEPVLDHRRRLVLAGIALAAGVAYQGGGFRFDAPRRPRLTERPTVAVVGTGKRTGKTAVAIELARYWRSLGRRGTIVTMGRGGPPEPVVLRAGEFPPTAEGLLALRARGLHAASDYVEDALFAGVDTVGTRRVGAGPSGVTVQDNFADGVTAAEGLDPDLMIFEGSGTALPPAASDATVLVSRSDLDPEYLVGYFGPYRLALADALV